MCHHQEQSKNTSMRELQIIHKNVSVCVLFCSKYGTLKKYPRVQRWIKTSTHLHLSCRRYRPGHPNHLPQTWGPKKFDMEPENMPVEQGEIPTILPISQLWAEMF